MSIRKRLLEILDRFAHLGVAEFENGTVSVGKLPDKQLWFLAHIFGPLQPTAIAELEHLLGRAIPQGLKCLLAEMNGASLFGAGQIALWGSRGLTPKGMPNYQPISLVNANHEICRTHPDIPDGVVFFGGYFGAFYFYTIPNDNTVFAVKGVSGPIVETWPRIDDAVVDLSARLASWFDDQASPIGDRAIKEPVLFG